MSVARILTPRSSDGPNNSYCRIFIFTLSWILLFFTDSSKIFMLRYSAQTSRPPFLERPAEIFSVARRAQSGPGPYACLGGKKTPSFNCDHTFRDTTLFGERSRLLWNGPVPFSGASGSNGRAKTCRKDRLAIQTSCFSPDFRTFPRKRRCFLPNVGRTRSGRFALPPPPPPWMNVVCRFHAPCVCIVRFGTRGPRRQWFHYRLGDALFCGGHYGAGRAMSRSRQLTAERLLWHGRAHPAQPVCRRWNRRRFYFNFWRRRSPPQ